VDTYKKGMETKLATAARGLTRIMAMKVSRVCTSATSHSGNAKRTVRDIASMSLVVRLSRSPVPARSTSMRGSAKTLARNSSRNCAKTFSPRM
jgi:hypothetical protein